MAPGNRKNNSPLPRVVVIGSGNVAGSLARAVAASDYGLTQLWARNAVRGNELANACGSPWAGEAGQLAEADIYLLAVSDRAIAEVAASFDFGEAIVAHTAASVSMGVLPESAGGRAIFYPLQTFSAERTVNFANVPIFVCAEDAHTKSSLETLARAISFYVDDATEEQLVRLHLAAVFACNFSNHFYAIAQRLTAETGLNAEVLGPLIGETTAKVLALRDAAAMQTGPARRGDSETVARHMDLLRNEPRLQLLYKLISNDIWETSKKR